MNTLAHTTEIGLIDKVWMIMEDNFVKDNTIDPLLRYAVIIIEKIGMPIVFCTFMGYLWLGMLAKYDKQQEMIFKMQQDNCIAMQDFSRNIHELKEAILYTRNK